MSKIVSPNPLVITTVVNEITGEIQSSCNRPMPHIQVVGILLQAAQGFIADGMKQAASMQKQLINPGGNPGVPPVTNPGGNHGNAQG